MKSKRITEYLKPKYKEKTNMVGGRIPNSLYVKAKHALAQDGIEWQEIIEVSLLKYLDDRKR